VESGKVLTTVFFFLGLTMCTLSLVCMLCLPPKNEFPFTFCSKLRPLLFTYQEKCLEQVMKLKDLSRNGYLTSGHISKCVYQ
jgi:hypothetical protein